MMKLLKCIGIVAVVFGLMVLIGLAEDDQRRKCEDRGGSWASRDRICFSGPPLK